MGMAGFHERPASDDDLLVCLCGSTLGTRKLSGDTLAAVQKAHAPDHKRRMAHQAYHRGPAEDCKECGQR